MKNKKKSRYFLRQDKRKGYELKQDFMNTELYNNILLSMNTVDQTCYDDWDGLTGDAIEEILDLCEECDVMCGASRYVIIPRCENYVIKINYPCWREDEDDTVIHKFSYNYNEQEQEVRKKIIRAYPDLQDFFLPLYKVIDNIYLQKKVIAFNDAENLKPTHDEVLKDKKFIIFCKNLNDNIALEEKIENNILYDYLSDKVFNKSDVGWWWYVYNCYGESVTTQLLKAIKKLELEDLHGGNIGFSENCPVLFDYVGFYE